MITQAVILCGGRGSRLNELTKKVPKPLLKVNNKPFVEYQIENLSRHGITEIILLCCYKYVLFKRKYHKKKVMNSKIICLNEKIPLGTGGGLLKFKDKLNKYFYVLNGDTIFDINYLDFQKKLKKKNYICIATTNKKGLRYGKINYSNANINAGIYILNKKIFKFFHKGFISLENDIFPKVKKLKKIQTVFYEKNKHNFLDIGIPSDFKKASKKIVKSYIKPAIFLDRDGVINEDYGYVHTKNKFIWKKGIFNLIKFFNDNNYYVFVITNQSGIGRGYYTITEVNNLHNWVQKKLIEQGAHIDKFYIAPYFAGNRKYKDKDKKLRKPNTGMIDLAFKEWKLNKKNSIIIGDQKSDEQLAKNTKINFIMVNKKNNLKKILNKIKILTN